MRLAPGTLISTDAILFDMDGTLVDSTAAIERCWTRWADRHDLDADSLIRQSHGVRLADTVGRFAPSQCDVHTEIDRLMTWEREETDGIVAVPGAAELIDALPPDSWALVTSADRALATRRMRLAGLPLPDICVCAEDVTAGKPAPEGYLKAAEKFGGNRRTFLVFEDSPAGLKAGENAGFDVIAIASALASAPSSQDWLADFRSIVVERNPDRHGITLRVAE